ncbi:MAG: cobalamin B12-binding domain-containing protein [Candidatus Omnitrophica bacterium]|nr:cobalamin B12-binding domain-containing protein [Candidatus Omnitrophota bacterium]
MADRLKVWLTSPTHSEVVRLLVAPLGIGYLASALQEKLGDRVEIKLFVYPDEIISALKRERPDLIGFSNYIWNHKLSLFLARYTKKLHPQTVTVMGGPHARVEQEGLRDFLLNRPYLDVYVPFEGETPICLLAEKLVEAGGSLEKLGHVPGCYINTPDYQYERLQGRYTINEYGSPYLKGILDPFLMNEQVFPLVESNRGCPYECTFCAWGAAVGSKVIQKNSDVLYEETEYIARKSLKDVWYFTDANFGIFKDDVNFATHLKKLKETYGHPKKICFHTAKNNAERVLEVSKILKDMSPINIALQSTDPEVLKQIKRTNLKTNDVRHFVSVHHEEGRQVDTDLLLPSSGETLESHVNSLKTSVDIGFDFINVNVLRLLPGTEMETDESRKEYGVRSKWRPLDIGWGNYDGEFVFEVDETIVETSAMKEEEVYSLKKLHFLLYLLWNYQFGTPLLKLGLKLGVNPLDAMRVLERDELLAAKILNPLYEDFKAEFFESEEELIRHHSESFRQAKNGTPNFQKLTMKYVARCIHGRELIHGMIEKTRLAIEEKTHAPAELLRVAKQLTLDRLRLGILEDPLTKTVRYELGEADFNTLGENGIIPKSTAYDHGGFSLTYRFPAEDLEIIKKIFKQLNYGSRPTEALYAMLTGLDVGTFFTYQAGNGASLPR